MRICILASDNIVDQVRKKAVEVTNLSENLILRIPVSSNGENPPTHWFCNFKVSQEMHDKLVEVKELSEMEVRNDWKKFLEEHDLKIIK